MAASFIESPSFPTGLITYGLTGGPAFATDVGTLRTGGEFRDQQWPQPCHSWDAGSKGMLPEDYQTLIAWHMVARGQLRGFRLRDVLDYQVAQTEGYPIPVQISGSTRVKVGTPGQGYASLTTYQLGKRYTVGSDTFDRDIRKPVAATVQVWKAGVLQTLTTDYTIDATTGILTFTSAPGAGTELRWAGQFDVPVRFGVDKLERIAVAQSGGRYVVQVPSIPIVQDMSA